MTHFEDMQMQGLRDICNELKEINRNLDRIANSAIAVMPGVEESKRQERLCEKIQQSREQLYEIIQKRTDELEAKNEEIQRYRAKIHAYEQKLKCVYAHFGDDLIASSKPLPVSEKPYHKGMEVTTFGAK